MTPQERCEQFVTLTQGQFNGLALMLGGPIYLVGSALTSDDPGDIDIRMMLLREDIEARWGEGAAEQASFGWSESRMLFNREMLKQSRRLTRRWGRMLVKKRHLPIDFQIVSSLFSDIDGEPIHGHGDKPRMRIDAIPLIYFAAGRGEP